MFIYATDVDGTSKIRSRTREEILVDLGLSAGKLPEFIAIVDKELLTLKFDPGKLPGSN